MQEESPFSHKLIYVFRINDDEHKGALKVGETTCKTDATREELKNNCSILNAAAKRRIKEFTNTAGITAKVQLLHTELAVRMVDHYPVPFRDKLLHKVLLNSGIKHRRFDDCTAEEWFETSLDTVINAIKALKDGRSVLTAAEKDDHYEPIEFRPEQTEAINKTVARFKKGDKMLWNAKMRFGKTLCALEVIRRCKFGRSLILTHRPSVEDGWYEDFHKIFYAEPDYLFGSKATLKPVAQWASSLLELEQSRKKYVYFASMQDLRGSSAVGGKFNKNDDVFKMDWDFILVDEAHEGTQTSLGQSVLDALHKKGTRILQLSGTPFNLQDQFKEDEIYTWDYMMEQEAKQRWAENHLGDVNPYAGLPRLNIFTYNLAEKMRKYLDIADKAFNFREFFRTWTGNVERDGQPMPDTDSIGKFVHEASVLQFLSLISQKAQDSFFPYSSPAFRQLFRHTLWLLPGVKEAKALSELLRSHQVFGAYEIVNVAGEGDEEMPVDDALAMVRKAIGPHPEDTYTITLSCGRLTTGVTVPAWTAVFMLAGTTSTSAAGYMQTIFRVQSPATIGGMVKTECYAFDFAPDRTLTVIAEAIASSPSGRTASESEKEKRMGAFLNFCPVIAYSGGNMEKYNTKQLMQQLKKVYIERAVNTGYDDETIYNENLLRLDDIQIQEFAKLRGIIGTTKQSKEAKEITISDNGFTDEEREKAGKAEKKQKKNRTPEEEELLRKLKERKDQKRKAISILRGISIRIPLLVYGADIGLEEEITPESFPSLVDDASWAEFMPQGVTKEIFSQFVKYYDKAIFSGAAARIRMLARSTDELPPLERVKKLALIFSHFRNPDKETVLTPWRVVNMHLSDCLGGSDFFDEAHNKELEEPRHVDQGEVTRRCFNAKSKVLEINAKTGLYALYVTYSIFRAKCAACDPTSLTLKRQLNLWKETLEQNVFVICKTPMAKAITQRTLAGYSNTKINAHCFDDLINQITNRQDHFVKVASKTKTYTNILPNTTMKFDAIVGNPPYQLETGGGGRQAKPIYQHFVSIAKKLNPSFISLIMPSRWFAGGMNLGDFRDEMKKDKHITKLVDYTNAKDCFPTCSISGGICYFLREEMYERACRVTNIHDGKSNVMVRELDEFPVIVRYNEAVSIVSKVRSHINLSLASIASPLMPFGLPSNYRGNKKASNDTEIILHASDGISYINKDELKNGIDILSKYKVLVSIIGSEHAGEPASDGKFRVLTSSMKVIGPNEACTHSYFTIGSFKTAKEAQNLLDFLKTQLCRFLILMSISSIHISKQVLGFVPLLDFHRKWTDADLYKEFGINEEEQAFIESLIKPM